MPAKQTVPFFHQTETHELVEELAHLERLTIFAGAGTSRDYGSPDWKQLVILLLEDRLLNRTDRSKRLKPVHALAAAHRLVEDSTPMVGATMVMKLFEEDFGRGPDAVHFLQRTIRTLLYRDWAPGGPLTTRIARLAITFSALDRDVAIITTNYDDNFKRVSRIDESLRQLCADNGVSIEACLDGTRPAPKVVPVYQLNGLIPAEGEGDPSEEFIFSEQAFSLGCEHDMPALEDDWRRQLIEERLELNDSAFLFIGTSLTDPTVIDCLARTQSGGARRFATFPKQGDPWSSEPNVELRAALGATSIERLQHLGLRAVRTDYFGQVSQLLNEIMLGALEDPGTYLTDADLRYGGRLRAWSEAWRVKVRSAGFAAAQDACQAILEATRGAIQERVEPSRGERLKIELWVRAQPSKRKLTLWCTSEMAWRTANSLHESTLENNSEYAAVQAFCQGHVVRDAVNERAGTRWRSYVSVPIVLSEPPWLGVTVGVVSLLSTAGRERSCLARVEGPEVDTLTEAGIAVVDPQTTWAGA